MWHDGERALYWNDIPNGALYRYDPATGDHEQVYDGEVVGGFTVQADGRLLLFGERASVRVYDQHAREVTDVVVDEVPDERETRFNDVVAGPGGRVYAGTMSTDDHGGRLYRLDTDGDLHRVRSGFGTPNGMGFTPDRTGFYFTDSQAGRIYRFAYDERTGDVSDRETVVELPDSEGVPDGMTVDAEGDLWSAVWNGNCAVRFTPDGEEVDRVEFPAERVTSVMFGGEDCEHLYATTAGGDDRAAEGDGAGALFRLEPAVGGVPEFRSHVEP